MKENIEAMDPRTRNGLEDCSNLEPDLALARRVLSEAHSVMAETRRLLKASQRLRRHRVKARLKRVETNGASQRRSEVLTEGSGSPPLRAMSNGGHRQPEPDRLRLDVLEGFGAMLAHELNQPLTAILNNVETALRMLESNRTGVEELREVLEDIREADLRTRDFVRALRGILCSHKLEMWPVDLNAITWDAINLAGGYAVRHGVQFHSRFAPKLPRMIGNEPTLTRVIVNLLNNSIDAIQHSGASRRQVYIVTSHNAKSVQISTRDTGPGISRENLPDLFRCSFTTKADGMGLGLPIAQALVQAHNGRIWAESALAGGGAAFHVAFPIARSSAVPRLSGRAAGKLVARIASFDSQNVFVTGCANRC